MKIILLFLLLALTQFLSAQTFTEVSQFTRFDNVLFSSIAFSDVDRDGDNDVLITGENTIGERISKLYSNDGMGIFIERTDTPFDSISGGSIAFSDVDGDGDDDVLITGQKSLFVGIAKLYTNDGMGNFTEMIGTPFEGVYLSSIAFSDVDDDGDDDVLITGRNSSREEISKLYINDGMGNFSEMAGTPFDGVNGGSIAFSDVDGDGDNDVLITGTNNLAERISKLYINDGMGNFTEITGTPFEGVRRSSIAFSDVDGDGDNDVLIAGEKSSSPSEGISKLYTNDGMGNFTEMTETPFDDVYASSVAFSDVDDDGDDDLLITGEKSQLEVISKLYTNDGIGNFSEKTGTPFDSISGGSIAFSDVDGDGDDDLLITGQKSAYMAISNLYSNDGMGNFSEISPIFDGVYASSIAFSDVDGDGDEDVLITGSRSMSSILYEISKLYTNDGMGNFSEMTDAPFEGVWHSSIAFSDVDGDGDEDVLITGQNLFELISKLYTNDGMGNFSEKTGTPFDGVVGSSIAFSDVDGDGDNDVLITGLVDSRDEISKLYSNDGMGNFSEIDTPFEGVRGSSIAFSDVDGDGDQDVLITGQNGTLGEISKLYTNNGMGNFSEKTGTPFDGVHRSSIAFSDVDGDGDEDVLITGQNSSLQGISKLYINDGVGNFSEKTGTPFDGVQKSSIAFSDVDGDGDHDVLITGQNSSGRQISELYTNDGMGDFSKMTGTPFDSVYEGSIAFSDVDGDGDDDVLITGLNNSSPEGISKLYTNDDIVSTDDLIIGFSLDFTLYPNPTKSNNIYIGYDSSENGLVTVSVWDSNGRLLSQQKEFAVIGEKTISIDIASLAQGSYFIKLDNGKRRGVAKFIVQ